MTSRYRVLPSLELHVRREEKTARRDGGGDDFRGRAGPLVRMTGAFASRVLSSASAATFMCNNCSAIGAHFAAARVMWLEMAFEKFG